MIEGYPVVADVTISENETSIEIAPCFKLIFYAESDCFISLNDNNHYKKYNKNLVIPIELSSYNSVPITKLYIKGTKGNLGIWGYR